MRDLLEDYARVNDECPCPVCGRPDWCLIHRDGRSAICSRVESSRPKGVAGWYHRVEECTPPPPVTDRARLTPQQVCAAWASLDEPDPDEAKALGLPVNVLAAIGARYSREKSALFFPMQDGCGNLTGGRFRRRNGDKWSLKGGKEGIFTQRPWKSYPPYVAVTEGATDLAAATAAGLRAVGRPSCNGGGKELRAFLQKYRTPPPAIVILSDPDVPGVNGSKKLASQVNNPCIILVGPTDFREVASKLSTSQVRHGILKAMLGEESLWKVVYRAVDCTPADLGRVAQELSPRVAA